MGLIRCLCKQIINVLIILLWIPNPLIAVTTPPIPEEYESTGGPSLAFGGSVASAFGGTSAVRANPALMALERQYAVSGDYHWPTSGRDFYQFGVVDGSTSSVAAGFSYTGAMEEYQGIASPKSSGPNYGTLPLSKDSPVIARSGLAVAMPMGPIFLGAGGEYIEAKTPIDTLNPSDSPTVKAFTLGFGMATNVTPSFRIGLSAENLANKKIQFAAPTFYRSGLSYFFGGAASVHLDYRRREAISIYEGPASSLTLTNDTSTSTQSIKSEDLINASSSIKIYDLLRFIVAAGHTWSEQESLTRVAGGLALVNQKFNFSYQALKPDLSEEGIHHALSLGIDVSL